MPKRGDKEFIKDIIEAIERINHYTAEMSYDTFLLDPKTQDAVVRNIEIIGEATKNLSHDFRKIHRDIDWKKIAGMRDKIIHFYFGVKWDIVWSVIKDKMPKLKTQIESFLKEVETENGS
jgi:uncharacterized protein with HEPN domain